MLSSVIVPVIAWVVGIAGSCGLASGDTEPGDVASRDHSASWSASLEEGFSPAFGCQEVAAVPVAAVASVLESPAGATAAVGGLGPSLEMVVSVRLNVETKEAGNPEDANKENEAGQTEEAIESETSGPESSSEESTQQETPQEQKPAASEAAKPAEQPAAPAAQAPQESAPPPPQQPPAQPAASPPPVAEKPTPPQPPRPTVPESELYTVRTALLKVEVKLPGKFDAKESAEIVLRPEAWTTLKVVRAVEHGAQVHKGDTLLQLELDRIDEAIEDQKARVELATLGLKRAEERLKLLEVTTPLELAQAERSKRIIDEDYDRFLKVERPWMEKSSERDLKRAQWDLEYELEELRQLEKMYQADELTEETEEIILRRQRNAVADAEFFLERSKMQYEYSTKFRIPRLQESLSDQHKRSTAEYAYNKATLPIERTQAKIELAQTRSSLERETRRLKQLEADRAAMVVTSPMDGVVYYGRLVRGNWTGLGTVSDRLRPGGTITPNEVIMTVVKPRPLRIWVNIPEQQVYRFSTGAEATVEVASLPKTPLKAKLVEMSSVPISEGNFVGILELEIPETALGVVPGVSCQVQFVPYLKQRTLVVPSSAIGTDELDPTKQYVMRLDESGRPVRQPVTVGEKAQDRVEILDGLVAGDRILKNYPRNSN